MQHAFSTGFDGEKTGNVSRAELVVEVGHVLALRLYDVAFAIDLTRAEALWAARATRPSARARLTSTPAKAMTFDVPPLGVELGPVPLMLHGGVMDVEATARLYDFGVLSLALKVKADNRSVTDFSRLMNAIQTSIGPGANSGPWQALLTQVRDIFSEAIVRPNSSALEEDYLLGVVHAFNAKPMAGDLLRTIDFVPMLAGETRPLSSQARRDLLRHHFSFYEDDLVILNWDRAFIYEPRGDSDVDDVLEVANAQLLEMRYYDSLLDAELPRMYKTVESTHRLANLFAARRYARLARQLNALVAQVTELTEKLDNALQVTEDVYLARIYESALEVFRVRTVYSGVERKLGIIRDTYRSLYDEASSSRAELMEVTVILLIALEIALALTRH